VGSLPERVAEADVSAPTLVIIGGVVSLRDKLTWFQTQEACAPSTCGCRDGGH